MGKMSISEDYEGSVTPIRSYISIFSRGTIILLAERSNQIIAANDRTKSLDDGPSHDRLETDSHSIRSFALLF